MKDGKVENKTVEVDKCTFRYSTIEHMQNPPDRKKTVEDHGNLERRSQSLIVFFSRFPQYAYDPPYPLYRLPHLK